MAGEAREHADEDEPIHVVDEDEFDALEEPAPTLEPAELHERVAAALAASTRAEANLRALFRTVKFLGASVGSARETNEHLLHELSALHGVLAQEDPATTRSGAESRAALLERALSDAREHAVREREFLIADQDAFIAGLIADHERELEHLERRVVEAEARLAAREAQQFTEGWDDDEPAGARGGR